MSVDKWTEADRAVVAQALRALEHVGLEPELLAWPRKQTGNGTGPTVGIRIGGRRLRFEVQVKRDLRPGMLGAIVHQIKTRGGRPLLVADHVTPPLAEALRDQGLEYVDAAGNVFLKEPPALVFVKGQRPARTMPVERGRAYQPAGLQVLFAILAVPGLVNRPYRDMARAAGTAHGTVGVVMAELEAAGFVGRIGGGRRLVDAERLLDRWVEAYARTLRPRLLLGRFRGDLETLLARTEWPDGVLIGGEPAGARLTRHLRPGTATLYAEALVPNIVATLRLRADPDGNVELRRRFWDFPGDDPQLVPTLLVYADLLAIGEARCLETAERLRGPLLARPV